MSTFRPKIWTGLGAAVLLSSAALTACSDGGEAGEEATTAGAEAPAPTAGLGDATASDTTPGAATGATASTGAVDSSGGEGGEGEGG